MCINLYSTVRFVAYVFRNGIPMQQVVSGHRAGDYKSEDAGVGAIVKLGEAVEQCHHCPSEETPMVTIKSVTKMSHAKRISHH